MPLHDLTGSCSGGGGSTAAAAAPLSTLAARLTERAAAPHRAAAPRAALHDADARALVHPGLHTLTPAAAAAQNEDARVTPLPLMPHQPPQLHPPPQLFHPPPPHLLMPIPEPDPAAATAAFEAAFAAAVPSPAFRIRPSPVFAPRPSPAVGPIPWMPPPHMTPPFPSPFHTHAAHMFGAPPLIPAPLPPPVAQQPPAVPPVAAATPAAPHEGAHAVAGPSGTQRTDSDELLREVRELLGARNSDGLNTVEQRQLGSLTGAQQSWGDGFTSMDSFGTTAPADGGDAIDALATQLELLSPAPATADTDAPYTFTEQNSFNTLDAAAALAEGERLRAEGHLAQALLALEAAVQPVLVGTPLERTQELRAWYLLGVTHAELDDDPRAIQALVRVANAEPNGGDDTALVAAAALAQAVSHVNELDRASAATQLRRWLSLRARALGEAPPPPPPAPDNDGADALGSTIGALRAAAEAAPRDADAQLAISVALHAAREHEEAARFLQRALAIRAGDARLWNMLGATLANGGRTTDALRAYRRAVDLSPRHVRAWVNVGTAYANLGTHDRAARYYLRALAMARADAPRVHSNRLGAADDMRHVWDYLRGALFSLDRAELLPFADACDLDAFREHFPF